MHTAAGRIPWSELHDWTKIVATGFCRTMTVVATATAKRIANPMVVSRREGRHEGAYGEGEGADAQDEEPHLGGREGVVI
jgi:hypothetical protein